MNLAVVTIDTDTTKSTRCTVSRWADADYNPKNQGKKSYQPMLTFIAETSGNTSGADCATATAPLAQTDQRSHTESV